MKIRLIAVGDKPRSWVREGFDHYARRLPSQAALELIQIPTARARTPALQAEKILAALSPRDWVVALDEQGAACDTHAMATKLQTWQLQARDVAILIGGADGLDSSCLARADETLSLSTLTFPHELVRVIVAEQLYRAWSILSGHPYHRG